jgi:hypothetical protein
MLALIHSKIAVVSMAGDEKVDVQVGAFLQRKRVIF